MGIILTVTAASAMPAQRVPMPAKPVTVTHKVANRPVVARPAIHTRPQMVYVNHVHPRYSYNKSCHGGCGGGCHGNIGGALTAMTAGLVAGGVIYALAR